MTDHRKSGAGEFASSERLDSDPGNPEFINPWAQCWGSRVRCPSSNQMPSPSSSTTQMHADAAAPLRTQMSGAGADMPPPPPPGQAPATEQGAIVRVLPIVNHKGLHARASAKFVQTAESFDASIKVTRGGETVGGLSIMGLMMLAAARGTEITVEANGPEAQAAMEAIEALVASKFGEEC